MGSLAAAPANSGPFHTVLAHQAHRLDLGFYDRFYSSGELTETPDQHQHTADQRNER